MKRILFPTEFSDHASAVFQYAVGLAHQFDARLIVMAAYGRPDSEFIVSKSKEEIVNELTDRMIDFVTTHLPDDIRSEVKIDYFVRQGKPSDAILEVESEEKINLIVMGMTGKKNVLNISFGSTTQAVIDRSDCRVLVVPATATYEGVDNMIYTTNFEFRDLAAINYLKKWSKKLGTDIYCLHIVEEKENGLKAVRNLKTLEKTYQKYETLFFDMVYGNFKKELKAYSEEVKADIIVMMTSKRSLTARIVEPGIMNGVAGRMDIPVLVLKDHAYEVDSQMEGWIKIVNSIA